MWGLNDQFTLANLDVKFLSGDRRCQLRKDKAQNIVRPDEGEEAILHTDTFFVTYHSNVEKFESMQDSVS